MKFLRLLLAIALLTTNAVPMSQKKLTGLQRSQRNAMHEIVMVDHDTDGSIAGGGLCTAYAVGPHTLLTAEHCNDAKTNAVYIDTTKDAIHKNQAMSYTIISRTFDHQDHMLLDVSGVYFKYTIELTDHVRVPVQGEHTYQWGCPAGFPDQYREGVVAGSMPNIPSGPGDEDAIDATGRIYLIQETVVGGDSGSAIFSATDGALLGVLTYGINEGKFAGMYAVVFTQAQINASLQ